MKKEARSRTQMLVLLVVKRQDDEGLDTYDDCRATIVVAPCRCQAVARPSTALAHRHRPHRGC